MSDRRVTSDGHVRICRARTESTVAQLPALAKVSELTRQTKFEISSSGTTKKASLQQLIEFLEG